jgi:hypothetical protein
LYGFFISSMSATCPAHLILLDLITLITFGEEYKLGTLHYAVFLSPVTWTEAIKISNSQVWSQAGRNIDVSSFHSVKTDIHIHWSKKCHYCC